MRNATSMVREFHRKMRAPVSGAPRLLPGTPSHVRRAAEAVHELGEQIGREAVEQDVVLNRAAMVLEELAEWLEAHSRSDLIAAADAWADRAYVLFGDAVAAGLPTERLFNEVHRSNMTKDCGPIDSGKAEKGLRYRPPELGRVLGLE